MEIAPHTLFPLFILFNFFAPRKARTPRQKINHLGGQLTYLARTHTKVGRAKQLGGENPGPILQVLEDLLQLLIHLKKKNKAKS